MCSQDWQSHHHLQLHYHPDAPRYSGTGTTASVHWGSRSIDSGTNALVRGESIHGTRRGLFNVQHDLDRMILTEIHWVKDSRCNKHIIDWGHRLEWAQTGNGHSLGKPRARHWAAVERRECGICSETGQPWSGAGRALGGRGAARVRDMRPGGRGPARVEQWAAVDRRSCRE